MFYLWTSNDASSYRGVVNIGTLLCAKFQPWLLQEQLRICTVLTYTPHGFSTSASPATSSSTIQPRKVVHHYKTVICLLSCVSHSHQVAYTIKLPFGSAVLARTECEKLEDQLNNSGHLFSTECPGYGETSRILPLQSQPVLASVISRILWGSTVKHSKTGQEQCNRYFNVYRNYITISCCTNM